MDPQFRSSFIPKRPVVASANAPKSPRRKTYNMITYGSTALFILSLLAAGGAFGYKYVLEGDIISLERELTEARKNIDKAKIDEYKILDARLSTSQDILQNHKIVSSFFEYLENNTLHNIQFNEFSFESSGSIEEGSTDASGMVVSMDGETHSMNAIALQAEVFENLDIFSSSELESLAFTSFNSEESSKKSINSEGIDETSQISFSLQTVLNPEFFSFVTDDE